MTAAECFKAGRLNDAVAAAAADVKAKPGDSARRALLAELLCFTGDLQRADTHLSTVADLSPDMVLGVGQFRQLIRAEQARVDFYESGRLPQMLVEPGPALQLRLRAAIALREGRFDEAATLLQQAQEQTPAAEGQCDGKAFAEFRDLDDLCAEVLEVFTGDGRFFWIPIESVETIEFEPPTRPRDLLWRQAQLSVRSGPDGVVFVPALYPGSAGAEDDAIRLGRSTQWLDEGGRPVRGQGQRMFLVGDEALGVTQMKKLALTAPAGAERGQGD